MHVPVEPVIAGTEAATPNTTPISDPHLGMRTVVLLFIVGRALITLGAD